jgi:hypothetical protein
MPVLLLRRPQGHDPGFPVLLPVDISAGRAQQLVTHLLDGNYLDGQRSKGMTAELLTYNPALQLLGYVRGDFSWTEYGQVIGESSHTPVVTGVSAGQVMADMQQEHM